jgi:replication fork clamp-binding protein CrfC
MPTSLLALSCQDLQAQVEVILRLLQQESTLRQQDSTTVQASLKKAIAPTFEIVFAGAFSAGKSMLINALLGRKLLYSAEGHATGTECQIAYAEPSEERVVLTFLSEAEIREQVDVLSQRLRLASNINIGNIEVIKKLQASCEEIVENEGGESKSDLAKQASALRYLLEGFIANREHIGTVTNNTFSMERFNFSNLQEAASYARRGGNSAVLKRIEYYCCDDLLKDGNVLVDTPGIDAPVKKDADLTYTKIKNPDISAVVCILKAAETGELTTEETELLETMRANSGIRDRVFYVFNRIDKTWYNAQLRQRLERLINDQFRDTTRVYKTSGLLGFYGSQIKTTSRSDRFGLDSIFNEDIKGEDGTEESPLFVTEFNNYCTSGKLVGGQFRIEVRGYELPNENYARILGDYGTPLIDQLIKDSGIEEFRSAIIRYLTEEKRPLLFANLADDLQPICIALRQSYLAAWQQLDSQPRDIDAIKAQELQQLGRDLKEIGDRLREHIEDEVNEAVASDHNQALEADYLKLKARMVRRLDELIDNFSVSAVHQRAQASHRRNSVVPVMGILAEGFYYLANELEDVLVDAAKEIIANFFQNLIDKVKKTEYFRDLYRLLGNDAGIEAEINRMKAATTDAIVNEAKTECDRYVRERPEFYVEGTVSLWQLQQTLQQACRGYDYQSMIESEPAIRQLLKLDFEQKVKDTVLRTFRQTINQTLNTHLLESAEVQADAILQKYDQAREYLAKTLEKEAGEKIKNNQRLLAGVKSNIGAYNQAASAINACLEAMQLDRKKLPTISEADLVPVVSAPPKDVPVNVEEDAIEAELVSD